jgi:plastocyanin
MNAPDRKRAFRPSVLLAKVGADRNSTWLRGVLFASVVVACGLVGFGLTSSDQEPREWAITVVAEKYAYDPAVIRVNRGDTLRLRFASLDVVHGFYLEGHDLDVKVTPMKSSVEVRRPSEKGKSELAEEVVFVADREGKFRYRCSETCGAVHPFMLGELIVGPNRLLPVSLGLTLGILVGGLALAAWPREER